MKINSGQRKTDLGKSWTMENIFDIGKQILENGKPTLYNGKRSLYNKKKALDVEKLSWDN